MTTRPDMARRAALAAIGSALAAPALARAPETSLYPLARPEGGPQPRSAAEIMEDAGLAGVTGFAALDADTGEVLEEWRSDAPLPPASALKAITAGYAFDRLGADHRFVTRLIATGPVVQGIVQGDLVLAGGGDPLFDTGAMDRLVQQLADAGVTGVRDRLLTWDGALPYVAELEPDQPDHLGYNPSLSGLMLNYNRVHFGWSRAGGAYTVTLDARSGSLVPSVTSARMEIADRALPVYTLDASGPVDEWTVARRQLGSGGARWLPVRNGAAYAADVMATLARGRGIALPPAQAVRDLPEGTEITSRRSEALPDIVRGMLRYSTNVTAAALGVSASASAGWPTSLEASGLAMGAWARARLGMRAERIVDHSGLGDRTRIPAMEMARGMIGLRAQGRVPALMKPFVLMDANGDLDPDHPVKVQAKTGTLNFVSALAGIASAPGGRQIAFAIFNADLDRRAAGLASGAEVPRGARPFNVRAKRVQRQLIDRWARAYPLEDEADPVEDGAVLPEQEARPLEEGPVPPDGEADPLEDEPSSPGDGA